MSMTVSMPVAVSMPMAVAMMVMMPFLSLSLLELLLNNLKHLFALDPLLLQEIQTTIQLFQLSFEILKRNGVSCVHIFEQALEVVIIHFRIHFII